MSQHIFPDNVPVWYDTHCHLTHKRLADDVPLFWRRWLVVKQTMVRLLVPY